RAFHAVLEDDGGNGAPAGEASLHEQHGRARGESVPCLVLERLPTAENFHEKSARATVALHDRFVVPARELVHGMARLVRRRAENGVEHGKPEGGRERERAALRQRDGERGGRRQMAEDALWQSLPAVEHEANLLVAVKEEGIEGMVGKDALDG